MYIDISCALHVCDSARPFTSGNAAAPVGLSAPAPPVLRGELGPDPGALFDEVSTAMKGQRLNSVLIEDF